MVWADGAECVAGIKAEVARTEDIFGVPTEVAEEFELGAAGGGDTTTRSVVNRRSWVEVGVDVQGLRDDDALNVFLAGVVRRGYRRVDLNLMTDFTGRFTLIYDSTRVLYEYYY